MLTPLSCTSVFSLRVRSPPSSTLFPYTTLFRSGKFIGEVERGEKSISIDSLYHVAVALEVPLRLLTDVRAGSARSEEHTSELQSHSDLVCRLLLEKKKASGLQFGSL